MSGIKDYAEMELDLYLKDNPNDDELDKKIKSKLREDVMALIDTFESQGHSGFSAGAVLQIFDRLAHYKPLTSLTGKDDEWVETIDEEHLQNKRCSSVFKDKSTGEAYDINGKVFTDDGGQTFHTTGESRVYISFPYNPPTKPKKVFLKGDKKNGKKEDK